MFLKQCSKGLLKKEKQMLTSLEVKAAFSSEDVVAILGKSDRLGKKPYQADDDR